MSTEASSKMTSKKPRQPTTFDIKTVRQAVDKLNDDDILTTGEFNKLIKKTQKLQIKQENKKETRTDLLEKLRNVFAERNVKFSTSQLTVTHIKSLLEAHEMGEDAWFAEVSSVQEFLNEKKAKKASKDGAVEMKHGSENNHPDDTELVIISEPDGQDSSDVPDGPSHDDIDTSAPAKEAPKEVPKEVGGVKRRLALKRVQT